MVFVPLFWKKEEAYGDERLALLHRKAELLAGLSCGRSDATSIGTIDVAIYDVDVLWMTIHHIM